MSRSARQAKILDIINTFAVDTQEELVSRLRADGFVVTQATISRDSVVPMAQSRTSGSICFATQLSASTLRKTL